MSDLSVTLFDLDAAGLDPTMPAPPEFIQFLYDNSRSGYLTLWSAKLAETDGASKINQWMQTALMAYHARALQTQMAPAGNKPAGTNVTEVTYSGPTAPPAPVNVNAPLVTGTPAVGSTLSCTMGIWDGEPTTYKYVWSTGAEGSTYVVQAGDAGTTITCIVSATNAGGETAAPPSNGIAIPGATGESQSRSVPRATPTPSKEEDDKKK